MVHTSQDLLEHCEDEHKHCGFWAEIGECDKNPEYMLQSCRESCDECDMPLDGMTGIANFILNLCIFYNNIKIMRLHVKYMYVINTFNIERAKWF